MTTPTRRTRRPAPAAAPVAAPVAPAAPAVAALALAAAVAASTPTRTVTVRDVSTFNRSTVRPPPVDDLIVTTSPFHGVTMPAMTCNVAALSTLDLAAVALLAARFATSGAASAHLDPTTFDPAIAAGSLSGSPRVRHGRTYCPPSDVARRTELTTPAARPVHVGHVPCPTCNQLHALAPITAADRRIFAARLATAALERLAGRRLDLAGDYRGNAGAFDRAAAVLTVAVDFYGADVDLSALRMPAAVLA